MTTWIIVSLSGFKVGTVEAVNRATAHRMATRKFPNTEIAAVVAVKERAA